MGLLNIEVGRRVVYKSAREFISYGLFAKSKGLFCGNPTEKGESSNSFSGCQIVAKSTAGCRDCPPQARGIHQISTLSKHPENPYHLIQGVEVHPLN